MANLTHLPDDVNLKPCQAQVYSSPARFRVLVAGRRFGKTYLALAEILVSALRKPNQLIWYVGPNNHQTKRIVWDRLKSLTRPHWAKRPHESRCRIDLTNGSTIVVSGAFQPDSLRGDGLDLIVLDECASMKPTAWGEVLRPALSDRQGRALFIGTPKGCNHFYEQFEFAKNNDDWAAFQFTTAQGGLVTPAEIAAAARELDPLSYQQEFGAEFITTNRHRVYYTFDRATHVKPVEFNPNNPLIWSFDFNVNPMCMLLMQRFDKVVHVFDEIIVPDGNSEAACKAFHKRFWPGIYNTIHSGYYPLKISIYGDASGHHRRTSGTQTDWQIVREFFNTQVGTYWPDWRYRSANPSVRDRVNCVNSRFRNTYKEARLFVHPRCQELIKDLEQVAWATDRAGNVTSELDKSNRYRTHTSDALGYYIAEAFRLGPQAGHQSSGSII